MLGRTGEDQREKGTFEQDGCRGCRGLDWEVELGRPMRQEMAGEREMALVAVGMDEQWWRGSWCSRLDLLPAGCVG